MTVIFKSKHNDENIEVKDVKDLVTDESWLGTTGYGIHYNDGTYNLYSYNSWKLVMIK